MTKYWQFKNHRGHWAVLELLGRHEAQEEGDATPLRAWHLDLRFHLEYRHSLLPPPPRARFKSPQGPRSPQYQPSRSADLAAYEYLNNVLNEAWTTPIELEILPPALQEDQLAIRVIETSVGIPNELLLLAFQYARNLFFDGLQQARNQGLQPWDDMQHTMSCTQIMLLFDPNHITAANERKHKLRLLFEPGFLPSPSLIDVLIRKELWLLDSLHTSPLPKHTKSPTLWSHRRWLIDEFLEWVLDLQRADVLGNKRMTVLLAPTSSFGPQPIDATDILWRSFVEPEMRVICNSGQQHRLNYHAWDFARRLVEVVVDIADDKDLDRGRLISSTVELVQQWCLSHLSDTSGWSFLLFLMGHLDDEGVLTQCFVTVGNLAISYRYRQEPVWVFIRTLLASGELLGAQFRAAFVGELQGWLESELDVKSKIEAERTRAQLDRRDTRAQPLFEVPYFDVVVSHLRWVRDRYEGEPRPAIFAPVAGAQQQIQGHEG